MTHDDPLQLVGTTVVEKYRVESLVAEGGFALLYLATHLIWNRPVALKVFRALGGASKANKEELLASFLREGALLAELSERSASICQARDVGMMVTPAGEGIPFMVLEWLEGRSLERVLDEERAEGRPPRTLAETMALLTPIAEALALAHARGVAHRDVKPANIFLLDDSTDSRGVTSPVKLLDFGIAKVIMDAQRAGGDFASTTGVPSAFTPSYASPEQFSRKHGSTGPWTDTFALALVAVECLTGKQALQGDDLLQFAYAATTPLVRPTPRTLGAAVSDEVEEVFLKALAVDVGARWKNVGEFWAALRSAVGQDPPVPVPPPSWLPPLSAGDHRRQSTPPRPASLPAPPPALVAAPAPAASAASRRASVAAAGFGFVALCTAGLIIGFRGTRSTPPPAPARPAYVAPLPSASPPRDRAQAPPAPGCPEGMVLVPGGQFFMGSDEGLALERPAHNVKLNPFCIDVHEVTTAQYVACSDDGKCKRASKANVWEGITPADHAAYDPLCNVRDVAVRAQHPINCVDWERADTFCKAHARRLPTEAEWEFAARGPDGRAYPWGDDAPSAKHLNACGSECVAWGRAHKVPETAMYADDDGWATTAPVGSFPAGRSRYGLEDVVGNVWEWVSDWYAPYTSGDVANPSGPSRGDRRVMRGGAWNGAEPSWVRPTFRFMSDPKLTSYGVGFRCAADAT